MQGKVKLFAFTMFEIVQTRPTVKIITLNYMKADHFRSLPRSSSTRCVRPSPCG
jgi:hypothetical protein